jgi:hypothetical protein
MRKAWLAMMPVLALTACNESPTKSPRCGDPLVLQQIDEIERAAMKKVVEDARRSPMSAFGMVMRYVQLHEDRWGHANLSTKETAVALFAEWDEKVDHMVYTFNDAREDGVVGNKRVCSVNFSTINLFDEPVFTVEHYTVQLTDDGRTYVEFVSSEPSRH